MTVGPLVLELIVVFCVSVFLLHHYGRITKQHPVVTVATLVAWYFSLIIVFILPLDVSSTFYRQCLSENDGEAASLGSVESNSATSESNGIEVTTPVNVSQRSARDTGSVKPMVTYASTNGIATLMNATNSSETLPFASTVTTLPFTTSSSVVTGTSVQSAGDECKKPWSYVPPDTLPIMWHIVYWSSQVLTWLVLPLLQSYVCAGDFSPLGKLKRAAIENAVYYTSYLFIFGALLIYVAASPSLSLNIAQLKILLITAANTWGLFLLVLLLGYGLVEVPRNMWYAANFERSTARTHFQLARLSTEKQEAVEDLEDILEEIKKVSEIVRYNHPIRKYVNIIISKCPDAFQSRVGQGMDDYEDYATSRHRSDMPTEKTLVRIHRQLIRAMHTQKRTSVQWKIVMSRALHLDDIAKNSKHSDKKWKEEFPTSDTKNICAQVFCNRTLEWYWYCSIQPITRKMLAICLAIFSLMVVWSECTFFNEKPVLSLFAIFVNLAKENYDYFYIEFACCLTISYLCVCAYYTVFRIKVFNYYYIAGHHQTDESSLLFVGIMLCRLTAPLCLNFLGLIHLDTHITGDTGIETSYTKIMGHLDVISIISDGFNIYFPILVCVLCVATYFSLGQRCLSAVGFQRFIDASDDMTSDLVDEGRQLVNREKRNRNREMASKMRSERDSGMNSDIGTRQWSGRNMRQAEAELDQERPSSVRFKRTADKLELLSDAEPIAYNSLAENENITSDTDGWRSTSSRTSYQKPRSNLSSRPPKNLFDDV